jgi:hypothetical protein
LSSTSPSSISYREKFRDTATDLAPQQYVTDVKHLLINGMAKIENGNATDLADGMRYGDHRRDHDNKYWCRSD